jgi:hypothetical protein
LPNGQTNSATGKTDASTPLEGQASAGATGHWGHQKEGKEQEQKEGNGSLIHSFSAFLWLTCPVTTTAAQPTAKPGDTSEMKT